MPRKKNRPTEKGLRRELTRIDREFLKLLVERQGLVAELADKSMADSPSEHDITELIDGHKGPFETSSLRQILKQIDSLCSSTIRSTDVAFLGPQFSYSYLAAVRGFGSSANLTPLGTIQGVFEAVDQKRVRFGVVPLENSTDGRIADTLTMFSRCNVKICREILFPVHHCLIGTGTLDGLKEIHSKAQALSQCRDWISKNLPSNTRTFPSNSTTEAAELAKKKGPSIAAIASHEAAVALDLNILASNIEDQKGNLTRFAVIVAQNDPVSIPGKSGKDKTSLMLEVDHSPGALADVMNIFKRANLNLTWIESFPKPGAFSEYTFFVEFQGHQNEARVRNAIEKLEKKTEMLTLLGSYPESISSE